MDNENTQKRNRNLLNQNYVPRKDFGDIDEDEAMERARSDREREAWNAWNREFNPNLRK